MPSSVCTLCEKSGGEYLVTGERLLDSGTRNIADHCTGQAERLVAGITRLPFCSAKCSFEWFMSLIPEEWAWVLLPALDDYDIERVQRAVRQAKAA